MSLRIKRDSIIVKRVQNLSRIFQVGVNKKNQCHIEFLFSKCYV